MRVTVAALACVPLLGARRGYYPRLQRILLYPAAFVAPHDVMGEDGMHSDAMRLLALESWAQDQVLLAWDEVQQDAADPSDGRNVVIPEFAHQLDQAKGFAQGAPLFGELRAYYRVNPLSWS